MKPELTPHFSAVTLTRELAEQHIGMLTTLANQIPQVNYAAEDILAEQKGDRLLHNKWQHSLVIIDNGRPIALNIGYERQAENNSQYPANTLYISELAVAEEYQHQGIARSLLRQFFDMNNLIGFLTLPGQLNYSVQTNAATWNRRVLNLYQSFGFKQRSTKQYPNRTDVILGATVPTAHLWRLEKIDSAWYDQTISCIDRLKSAL